MGDDHDGWSDRSSGGLRRLAFAQALAGEFDAVGVVHHAIEDGIGERRDADDVVPAVDRHLAGDQERAGIVAILDDLQEIARLLGQERLGAPVVEDRAG